MYVLLPPWSVFRLFSWSLIFRSFWISMSTCVLLVMMGLLFGWQGDSRVPIWRRKTTIRMFRWSTNCVATKNIWTNGADEGLGYQCIRLIIMVRFVSHEKSWRSINSELPPVVTPRIPLDRARRLMWRSPKVGGIRRLNTWPACPWFCDSTRWHASSWLTTITSRSTAVTP